MWLHGLSRPEHQGRFARDNMGEYTEEELNNAMKRSYAITSNGWNQGYAYHILGYLITETRTELFENYPHERDVKVGE